MPTQKQRRRARERWKGNAVQSQQSQRGIRIKESDEQQKERLASELRGGWGFAN